MEPLQLGVLAGMTPPEIDIMMFDDRMESIPYDLPTDLVAITVETFTARRAYEIAAEYHKRGVPVVMGGMHATLIPQEVNHYADSVYIGDAEFRWRELIEDARKNQLKSHYVAPAGIPQPGITPRRDIFVGKGYLPITLMQFGRGCRFTCDFCAVSIFFNKKHFYRCVDEVLNEIEKQKKAQIFFVDDNILSDQDAAKILFRELIGIKVRWVSQASIDMTNDLELMDLMAQSGCLGNVIGFESIDPDNLRLMNKMPNLNNSIFQEYASQIKILRDFGLQTWAAFTLGHDYDTVDSIRRTVDWAIKNKFTFAAYNVLMPYPNTPLYHRLESEKRLLYNGKWWLHPNYHFNHAAFVPKNLTPDKLTEEAFRARSIFNSIPSLIQRVFDFRTNMRSPYRLGVYLTYTPLFRKETFRKQGMNFGYH